MAFDTQDFIKYINTRIVNDRKSAKTKTVRCQIIICQFWSFLNLLHFFSGEKKRFSSWQLWQINYCIWNKGIYIFSSLSFWKFVGGLSQSFNSVAYALLRDIPYPFCSQIFSFLFSRFPSTLSFLRTFCLIIPAPFFALIFISSFSFFSLYLSRLLFLSRSLSLSLSLRFFLNRFFSFYSMTFSFL